MDRNQLECEARAKIIWGDEPDAVIKYLMMNGLTYDDAAAFTEDVVRERLATIRATGLRKLLFGLLFLAVPVAAYLAMARIGYVSIKLLALAIVVGLWGAWKLLQGIMMIAFPESETGDLADESD